MRTIFLTLNTKTGETSRPSVVTMDGGEARAEAARLVSELRAHGYKAAARVVVLNTARVWTIGYQEPR